MSIANDPAPLTLAELRLAAAAVTALLPKYPRIAHPWQADRRKSHMWLKLKLLQLRLFQIEQAMTGDHPLYLEATQAAPEEIEL